MSAVLTLGAMVFLVAGALLGLGALAHRSDASRSWSEQELGRRSGSRGSGVLATALRVVGEEIDGGGRRGREETRDATLRRQDAEAGDGPATPGAKP